MVNYTNNSRGSNMIRQEIQELAINNNDTLSFNGQSLKKGSVAQFGTCINYIEECNPNREERDFILQIIDKLLLNFISAGFENYFSFKQKYIQQRYDELLAMQKK